MHGSTLNYHFQSNIEALPMDSLGGNGRYFTRPNMLGGGGDYKYVYTYYKCFNIVCFCVNMKVFLGGNMKVFLGGNVLLLQIT